MFTAKAWNARVLTQFFHVCLADASSKPNQYPDADLPVLSSCLFLGVLNCKERHVNATAHTCALVSIDCMHMCHSSVRVVLRTALARFHGLQERGHRTYSQVERIEVYRTIIKFCQRYIAMAKIGMRPGHCREISGSFQFVSVRRSEDIFRVRPKLHVPSQNLYD